MSSGYVTDLFQQPNGQIDTNFAVHVYTIPGERKKNDYHLGDALTFPLASSLLEVKL